MGKAKAKGRRGRDDDDFECAVQALEIDAPAAQPQQADDESSELDELLERALALCLISEASYDELTDELADGTRNEAEVCDEWRLRLQQWEVEQNQQSPAATPAPAAVPRRVRNALSVLGSLDELDALTAAAGADGFVVVMYTAKWCGQCRKIAPFVSAALPAEFGHVRFYLQTRPSHDSPRKARLLARLRCASRRSMSTRARRPPSARAPRSCRSSSCCWAASASTAWSERSRHSCAGALQ